MTIATATRPWMPYNVEFVSDFDRPELAVSPWGGHRWFAYDLVRWARPNRVVELGTHYGCSLFAFCQAVLADHGDTEVVAIDTWEGEEHTGRYGEEVYQTFAAILERRYSAVLTRILRSTFDEALDVVPDGSVDILHIDGLHTYDAVRHDYETWRDKVAPNGIVLFHDVAPSSGYGSARFWQEVRETAPGFAFMHNFGLGVLLPNGTEGREALLELDRSPWRPYYEHRAGHDLRSRQVIDLTAMVEARDEALRATEDLVVARDEALRATETLVAERTESLEATRRMVDDRDAALTEAEKLMAERRAALTEAQRTVEQRERELAKTRGRLAADGEALTETRRSLDEAAAEIEHLHHQVGALTADRDAQAARLDLYRRALGPVRWASRPARRIRRALRSHGAEPAPIATPPPPGDAPEYPPLFDPDWYLARYPDVGRAGIDPWQHWSSHGWREGREPCPLFNAGAYLEQHPDVAAAAVDPLLHWVTDGWREGRDPSPLFNTDFYRQRYELPDDLNPLEHYLTDGIEQGLFISADHERQVLAADGGEAAPDELLVDVVLHHPDGSQRSVPFPMVVDSDADLFTFDLWDTILTRTRPADSAKLATARRLRLALGLRPGETPSTWDLMRRRVEIEADIAGPMGGEYLLSDVLTRLLAELPVPVEHDGPGLVDHLRRAELEDEMAGTTPIDETLLVMDKLLGRGESTQVAVLSDFYLDGDDLRDLLAHHGLADDRLVVISSADLGRSKHRGGALFEWARDHFDVPAARHLHVGDNPHADVAMQTATGGMAVHLVHGRRRFAAPGALDETKMADVMAELAAELGSAGELHCRQAGLRPRPENRVLQAAWRTALLPVALVAAAIEDAAARGLDRVHYISREGLFLARVHERVAAILMPDGSPTAVHLAVSRRSTFGPSLPEISADSLLDLWRMYSRQTLRGLLVSLGAQADEYASAAERFGLTLDETIDGIHLDGRIRSFLGDPELNRGLTSLNEVRRKALIDYLGGQTDLGLGELLVVDVGWRGTTQDNLARLLPDTRLVGWYLALFPFLNPQPGSGEKFAVGPDGNRGQEFAFMEPPAAVERPWTPAAPSVIDYRTDDAGRTVPVLDEEMLDDDSRDAIARYQDAVVEAAATVARWIKANGAATDVLRPLIERELTDYYTTPSPGVADLWFGSAHDDTFGVLNVTSFGKERPGRHWFGDGLGPGFLRQLDAAAGSSLWPAGYRRWRPVEAATAVERALRNRGFL